MKKRKMIKLLRVAALCLLLSGVMAAGHTPAQANGVPVRVLLSYVRGVSTWGPADATGVAEVAKSEGEVSGSVIGLPPLQGEVYHIWLMNTGTGETFPAGSFTIGAGQHTASFRHRLLTEIPDRNWNLLLLTVEREGGVPQAPGDQKSLAGYFPSQTSGMPQQLPRTGTGGLVSTASAIPDTGDGPRSVVLAAGLLALVCAAGTVLARAWRASR